MGAYAADTNCIRQPTALALAFGLKYQPEVQSLHHRPDSASPGYTRLKADGERELSQLRWRLVPAWEKVSGQTDYAVKVIGAAVDLNDYSFDGKWTDNYLAVAGGQSGEVVSGVPKVTSSAYRNHGEFVAQNPTKNDAAHSCIGMPVKNAK